MSPFNANEKASFQPWSERDFHSDVQVQYMKPIQRWMYRQLCQVAWDCETRPNLPDDDGLLWMLAGCESREQWEENKSPVRAMFTAARINDRAVLTRKRLLDDWSRLEEKRNQMRELGRKGGKAKASRRHPKSNARLADANQTLSKGLASKSKSKSKSESKSESKSNPSNPPVDGGTEGAMQSPLNSSYGQEKEVNSWREDFQKEIQRHGLEHCEQGLDEPIVFRLPLPESVFKYVEDLAQDSDLESAQWAILDWLDARQFSGLRDVNAVWDKMLDEMMPFAERAVESTGRSINQGEAR